MLEVRAARAGEEAAIVPLYEWLFAPPGSQPPAWDPARAERALLEAIESEGSQVFVGFEPPAQYLGLCTVYLDLNSVRFGRRAWIEDLAVDPGRRSQGIGSRLLGAAREWARERGASHLELDSAESRTDAHRFYEREGAMYRSYSFGWEL